MFWLGLDSIATFFSGSKVGVLVVDSALDRRLAGNERASPSLVGYGHYWAAAVKRQRRGCALLS